MRTNHPVGRETEKREEGNWHYRMMNDDEGDEYTHPGLLGKSSGCSTGDQYSLFQYTLRIQCRPEYSEEQI